MAQFKIGDRVVVKDTGKHDARIVNGKHGIVMRIRGSNDYGIDFGESFPGSHNLCGEIKRDHGWNVYGDDLELEKEEKKMAQYKAGDRVLVTVGEAIVNAFATVIKVHRTDWIGVEFDTMQCFGHDMNGLCPSGRGWNVSPSEIQMMKEEVKMGKFNVGDRVMIRYFDDMAEEFSLDRSGDIKNPSGTSCFIRNMKHLCGRQATISFIDGTDVHFTDWSDASGDKAWSYSTYMVCLVKKVEPKKKLTVAEIEKALGYSVEIVKG
jgi:hypothetical protein